jgi:protein-disulfide isomerase
MIHVRSFRESLRTKQIITALGLAIVAVAIELATVNAQTAATEPLAEVNGELITASDLARSLGARLTQLEEQIYNLKRQELDAIIAQRLVAQEAKKRGISVAALVDAEVTSKVTLVTEGEIDSFYQANKAGLRGDEATVRQQIRTFLQQQKLTAQRDLFVKNLRARAQVVDHLPPPPLTRVEVSIQGAPVRGPIDAPVTVVEFSDFECPFCKQAHTTLIRVMERYKGKIKHVYRDLPLEKIHAQAIGAAVAARCANEQGKFWEYHDVLFTHAPKLSTDDLKQYAAEIGLDVAKFSTCISSGKHKAAVQKDAEEGLALGITGTPAFFINGRPLGGAQSLETFIRVIDDELARIENTPARQ